jgi:hypothetical protein
VQSFLNPRNAELDDLVWFDAAWEQGISFPEIVKPGHLRRLGHRNLPVSIPWGYKRIKELTAGRTGAAWTKNFQLFAITFSMSPPVSRKPSRRENVISPITSDAKRCSQRPKLQTLPVWTKSVSSREKKYSIVELTYGSNETRFDMEYMAAMGCFIVRWICSSLVAKTSGMLLPRT